MTGDVSWMQLEVVATVLTAIIAGMFAVTIFIWNKHNGIYKAINSLQVEIVNVRLENAQQYVSNQTLEKVEIRLTDSIKELGEELKSVIREFNTR